MRRRVPRRPAKPAPSRVRHPRRRAGRRDEDRPPDALIFDVSRRLDERTPAWAGDVPFSWRTTASLGEGSQWESSCFTMSAHLGTHADAPSHVFAGAPTAGSLPLAPFLGPARVVDLPGRGEVGPDALPRGCLGVPRILFRTAGRAFLAPLAAVRLAERGAILVGTDAASIDPADAEDLPVHRMLLGRGVFLLEGLDLSATEPGDYRLVALPMPLGDLDAAPVRAVLIRDPPRKRPTKRG